MAKPFPPKTTSTRRSSLVLIGASLVLASIGTSALFGRGEPTARRRTLAAAETTAHEATPRPSESVAARSLPARVARLPEPARPVAKPAGAAAPDTPDPFYDAPSCPSLVVIRAAETRAGSDAMVEIAAADAPPRRLRLGDNADGRLLTFVGPHPKSGRLTVVFEGESGTCSAALRSNELALYRADRQASLSASPDTPTSADPDAVRRTSEFAVALGDAQPNPSDFLPTTTGKQ
jgi:hypothetical protein